jgi:predicted lipoprotein with Yx(FWY)xxD motif
MKDKSLTKRSYWLASLGMVIVLALAACQPELPAATPVPPDPTSPVVEELPATGEEEVMNGVSLEVANDPTFGEILVDGEGMTLYMFTVDGPNQSNCDEGCLQAWPPLLADGEVEAGEGVDASLIGTGTMLDGRSIVTYNEMPLYYWVGDSMPGDTSGQGVNGVWFVVSPEGEMVNPDAAPDASSMDEDAVLVNVANHSTLGRFLVDADGMTLYMFTVDEPDKSNCAGECLQAWPPLIAESSAVRAGDGVDEDMLGTAEMEDGSLIVTYNRMPLYYWVGDTQPGQTNGQDVNNVWFVVSPEGKPIGPVAQSDSGSDSYYEPDY